MKRQFPRPPGSRMMARLARFWAVPSLRGERVRAENLQSFWAKLKNFTADHTDNTD